MSRSLKRQVRQLDKRLKAVEEIILQEMVKDVEVLLPQEQGTATARLIRGAGAGFWGPGGRT